MIPRKITSFDPASFRNLGFCNVQLVGGEEGPALECQAGTIVNPNDEFGPKALYYFRLSSEQLLVDFEPDLVIVEKTSSFSGGFVAGQVSGCIGVILSSCGMLDVDVDYVFPTHVKKIVTGSGKASKSLVKKSVTNILNRMGGEVGKLDSSHAYDAVANVLCWLFENKFIEMPEDGGNNE